MAEKRYKVCIPRPYVTAQGTQKTHFWQVGTAFPLREHDGMTVKLYSRMLLTDQLVILVDEPREASEPQAADDDTPF